MKTRLLKIKKMNAVFMILFSSLLSLTFTACDETETATSEDEYTNIVNESYASELYDEVEDLGDEAVDFLDNSTTKSTFESDSEMEGLNNYYRLSPCATVTREYRNDSVIITIDFGEENCLCNDGRERRGKIHINHYGFYWGEGEAEIAFWFENYFVDDNQLTGSRNVYRYMNENQHRISEIFSDGAVILAEGAGTVEWHAERVREVVEGSETHFKYDDIIEITGSSNAKFADGTEITSTIISPLVRKNDAGCFKYFVKGIREIINGEDEIIIDYGDGTCDNLAELTRNGVTNTIEIQRRKPLW